MEIRRATEPAPRRKRPSTIARRTVSTAISPREDAPHTTTENIRIENPTRPAHPAGRFPFGGEADAKSADRRLIVRISYRLLLLGHACRHQRVLGCNADIPGFLERTPDVGIFRARVERNQPHAVRALHLIAAF